MRKRKERPDGGPLNDASTVEEQRELIKLTQAQEDADWAWLMSQPAGRRVAATILRHCNVLSVPFNESERRQTFDLGQLNVAHWMLRALKRVAINDVRLMEDEERTHERNSG